MTRVLVTGAAGYVGAEVVHAAAEQGFEVVAAWHRKEVAGGVQVDVRDEDAFRRLVRRTRPDAIVHAAFAYGGPDRWSVTVDGSAAVARVAAAAGARLVHVSSDVVFDGERRGRWVEDDPLGPANPYAEAKAAAEAEVLLACPGAALARSPLVIGGESVNPQRRLVLDALDGRADVVFFTDVVRTPVVVEDVAAALVELATGDHAGPIHLGGPEAISRADLAARIAVHDLGRAADELRTGPAPPGYGPRNAALDSSLAAATLSTPLRGVDHLFRRRG